jgi:hypothetical protein
MSPSCDRREPLAAFAYLRERDEHWPILLCDACGQITAGRVPKPPRRTGPDFDERDVIVARWRERWPRSGRPRTNDVPADTVWVEDLPEDW